MDKNEFLFILPETEESVTSELRDKIKEHLEQISLPSTEGEDAKEFKLIPEFGMAQWRKGDDVALLMERARESLEGTGDSKVAV